MVDRTVYDPTKVPELGLRQVFGRQRLSPDLCKLAADCGLLSVETFAMLGDTIGAVKDCLKTLVGDVANLGATPAAQELALTPLAATWKTCSTLQDHFHGSVPFYEVGEFRTRTETAAQKSASPRTRRTCSRWSRWISPCLRPQSLRLWTSCTHSSSRSST